MLTMRPGSLRDVLHYMCCIMHTEVRAYVPNKFIEWFRAICQNTLCTFLCQCMKANLNLGLSWKYLGLSLRSSIFTSHLLQSFNPHINHRFADIKYSLTVLQRVITIKGNYRAFNVSITVGQPDITLVR